MGHGTLSRRGSEFDAVVLALSDGLPAPPAWTRNILYTAITRQAALVIVGSADTVIW